MSIYTRRAIVAATALRLGAFASLGIPVMSDSSYYLDTLVSMPKHLVGDHTYKMRRVRFSSLRQLRRGSLERFHVRMRAWGIHACHDTYIVSRSDGVEMARVCYFGEALRDE